MTKSAEQELIEAQRKIKVGLRYIAKMRAKLKVQEQKSKQLWVAGKQLSLAIDSYGAGAVGEVIDDPEFANFWKDHYDALAANKPKGKT
jgi:hypothetical protein